MTGRLDGRVALITGAAGGIGAAIASRFHDEGARVLITDADADGVQAMGVQLDAPARVHDVTDEAAWRDVTAWALDTYGGLDVLVNNAGIFFAGSLQETTVEVFSRVQEVNQLGVLLGMRCAAPVMVAAGSGSIINMSSVAGRAGVKYLTAYAASKWAVRGMTKCVARELASAGVRVNSLHPGQIDTSMNSLQRERTPGLVDKLVAGIPMRRIGQPEEVAAAALYFASDDSRYVTGAEIVIDGGTDA